MNSGHDDRLDAVTQDLHAVLERKLGDLLGQVRAAQRLAREVEATDGEVRRRERLAEQLRTDGHDEHASLLEREVRGLLEQRQSSVEGLSQLVSALHG